MADDVAVTILLELFDAAASGKDVTYSSICSIDGVSASTTQRRVQEMIDENILLKVIKDKEKRRYSIKLSEKGLSVATNYLKSVDKYVAKRI